MAKALAAGAPTNPRQMAAKGWARIASFAHSSGCAFLRNPYSAKRPATCAGPTSAAAPIATATVAPVICSNCGRWAAMAVLINHETANT
ncbi:hypothetical protein D3C71_1666320 [compost metagenome]